MRAYRSLRTSGQGRQHLHANRRLRRAAQLEALELRRLLTVTSTFELDANVVRSTTHDWDQIYADHLTDPVGTSSGAVASAFVTDKVNSNTDDIFTGGG